MVTLQLSLSVGWQSNRANLAANYTHTASSGQGLFGAYNANAASASGGLESCSFLDRGIVSVLHKHGQCDT